MLLINSLGPARTAYAFNENLKPIQHFVETGKLPSGVQKKIEETGYADLLITLNVDDIREQASKTKKARGIKNDDSKIIAEKSRRYNQLKNSVSKRLISEDYTLLKNYEHLPAAYIRINEHALTRLLNMSDVISVSENHRAVPHLIESLPLINAPQAYTGAGTSVAVLDTGVDYTLAEFGSCTAPGAPALCKIAYVQDFAPDDGSLDDNGHGTNVSGIVIGVAPDTDILGLDVFRTDGYAYYSDIYDALDWVLANQVTYNIVAVNMSLGGGREYSPCPLNFLSSAITDLKTAGITTSISSGNDTYIDSIGEPACAPDAVSVGAVYDEDIGSINWSVCNDATTAPDKVTCFSNSASFLTILAPGALITAGEITMGGTSQAAPHIAGSVASMKEADGTLTVAEIVNRLTSSGVPVLDTRNSITKPRVDLFGALGLSDPLIGFNPNNIDFNEINNGELPPDQTLNITNDGVGTMNWTVSESADWLSLSPLSGIDDGPVTVSITRSDLSPGTYNEDITISSTEALISPLTVPVTLAVYDTANTEDFETGDLSLLPWSTGGDGSWFVQGTTTYAGTYSAQSADIADNEISYLEVTLNITSPGYVYFWFKTSTEYFTFSGDKLMFKIDDINEGPFNGWSGENDWAQQVSNIEVDAGFHTFTWIYDKDISVSAGSDAVWIDDIVFPPFNLEIPYISSSPALHDFGTIPIGSSSPAETFTVSNIGTANLVIGGISLSGTDASMFSKQNDTCSSQTLIPAGNCTVDVIFSPTSEGAKTANLSVPSNDPLTPTLNVSQSGTGAYGPARIGITDYPSIQSAYIAAIEADTIEMLGIDFTETFTLDQSKSVTLSGGYESDFLDNPLYTTVIGSLTFSGGPVIVENIIIQ